MISPIILLVLFGAGLAGGLVALPMRAQGHKTSWLCFGGTFAGGAFLATAIFQLGPEAMQDLGLLKALLMAGGLILFLRWLDRQGHNAHAEIHGCHPHGGGVPAKPYILGAMLGFHSLLEGLALGSVAVGAAREALALAILIHKATDTFALAVTLGRYGVSRTKILGATVILSLASPGGALLASMADISGPHLLHGILGAATAGTFLYLAGSDLLLPELKEKEGRPVKILAAAIGFLLITGAAFLGH
ncbi:MAG: ZIP family metal transporter [Verrucomicrobia bacterium]|nr:ZIP family metal transporter [Verrucomicrobiota bacterium]